MVLAWRVPCRFGAWNDQEAHRLTACSGRVHDGSRMKPTRLLSTFLLLAGLTLLSACEDDPEDFVCGNAVCESAENATNCAVDCAVGSCGNGSCDADEDASSCAADCAVDCADADEDLVCDGDDNCPDVANADQANGDNDSEGDACDDDDDNDTVADDDDNCPEDANTDQADGDSDGLGDACDACPSDADDDSDGDGACGSDDNCPDDANPDQADGDNDGIGDLCDACPDDADNDRDSDSVCGDVDNCPETSNPDQGDGDGDGIGDLCDECPTEVGGDVDGDGLCPAEDNCPEDFNASQLDSDDDGAGNACDSCPFVAGNDDDGDDLCPDVDNCPEVANPGQEDTDGDGDGDACDACPEDATGDTDGDSVCDSEDVCQFGDDTIDENNDGVPDQCEDCPFAQMKRFVITWDGVYTFSRNGRGDGPLRFQIVFFENGDIEYRYREGHSYGQMRVGMEDNVTPYALNYGFPDINIVDESRLIFTPQEDDSFAIEESFDSGAPWEWAVPANQTEVQLADDGSTEVPLPFDFPFRGRAVSSVHIASNGYAWFGTQNQVACCSYAGDTFPTGISEWDAMFALVWTDLDPQRQPGTISWGEDTYTCTLDCNGDPLGYARVDDCGVCAGGATGVAENADMDCNGVCNGTAFQDNCGTCSGGDTDHTANSDDVGCGCFEDPAGEWYPDTDGDGLGAGSAVEACRLDVPVGYVDNDDDPEPDCATNDTADCGTCGALDCTGLCNGGAEIDACNICAGGNTGIEPADPTDGNDDGVPDACIGPDLFVDADYMAQGAYIDTIFIRPDDCYIPEGCVTGSGLRKVLRFPTLVANIGTGDMTIGIPEDGNPLWEYDACHDHYHFDPYADYQIYNNAGNELANIGHKNGFCVLDLVTYEDPQQRCNTYTCSNQGITAGCGDIYDSGLDCQWVDITTVEDGDYRVVVTTNPRRALYELDYTNNTAEINVTISGNDVTVNSHGNTVTPPPPAQ